MGENLNEKELDGYIEQLVIQIENNGLIKAPPNMKYEIMYKIESEDRKGVYKLRHKKTRMSRFYYGMKVGVVAAMALIVMFSVEYTDTTRAPRTDWKRVVVGQMNEKTTQINRGLTLISNQILRMEVVKSDKEEK